MNPETATAAQQAMRFGAPHLLWLLLLLPAWSLLAIFAARKRHSARRTWAGALFDRLTPGLDSGRERMRWVFYLAGTACVILALARPQWGGELVMMKRQGIDVLVALDTSNSMLAEDMRPNRLASAKRAIADLVRRMGGDRLGLMAFAGEGYVVCPLTLDHGTVLMLLDSMNPNTVSVQGSNLEDAIRRARAAFVRKETKHKALVLVSDGESTTGDPVREAEQAAEEGIVVYAIGIGSPDGQPIPERDERDNVVGYKRDRGGQVVNSRLDEGVLRRIAEVTRGKYYRASAQGMELNAVINELQSLEKKELEGQLATHFEERYQWPLALALVFLALEMLVPNRRRRQAVASVPPVRATTAAKAAKASKASKAPRAPRAPRASTAPTAAALAVVCGCVVAWLPDAGAEAAPLRAARLNGQANRAYEAKEFEEAARLYDEAQAKAPDTPEIAYNLGNALYRQGKMPDAVAHLRHAAESQDPSVRQRALYNLGNALHDSGQLQMAAQAYRQAMRLDAGDLDAKINYEKTLQEMQQGGQDQQQQNQNQKSQQNQQNQGGQDQKSQQGDGEQDPQESQSQQGEGDSEQDRQAQQQQQQEQQQREQQQQGKQNEKPGEAQEQEAQMAEADSIPGGLTREEALRILEAMRDQEKELQRQRAEKIRARSRRVDKDW